MFYIPTDKNCPLTPTINSHSKKETITLKSRNNENAQLSQTNFRKHYTGQNNLNSKESKSGVYVLQKESDW